MFNCFFIYPVYPNADVLQYECKKVRKDMWPNNDYCFIEGNVVLLGYLYNNPR
jgi:hypothetical protein